MGLLNATHARSNFATAHSLSKIVGATWSMCDRRYMMRNEPKYNEETPVAIVGVGACLFVYWMSDLETFYMKHWLMASASARRFWNPPDSDLFTSTERPSHLVISWWCLSSCHLCHLLHCLAHVWNICLNYPSQVCDTPRAEGKPCERRTMLSLASPRWKPPWERDPQCCLFWNGAFSFQQAAWEGKGWIHKVSAGASYQVNFLEICCAYWQMET